MLRKLFGRSKDKSTACPYCGENQEPPPQRKRNCRNCKRPIFVRKLRDGTRQLLTKEEAIRREQDQRDRRRKDLRKQTQSALGARDWRAASQAHHSLASVLFQEGREYYREAREGYKHELLSMREAGIKKVEIMTCDDERVCDDCRALHGRVFTIRTALKNMPLPGQHCKDGSDANPHGGRCRCVYVAVL